MTYTPVQLTKTGVRNLARSAIQLLEEFAEDTLDNADALHDQLQLLVEYIPRTTGELLDANTTPDTLLLARTGTVADVLYAEMEARCWDPIDVVQRARGLSVVDLDNLLRYNEPISPQMDRQLCKAFETSPGFWLDLQSKAAGQEH